MPVQQQLIFLSKAANERPRSDAFLSFLEESKQRYILQGHIILSLRGWHNSNYPRYALKQGADDKSVYCLNDKSEPTLAVAISNLKTRQAPVFMIENNNGGGNNSSNNNSNNMLLDSYSGNNNGGGNNNNFSLGNNNNNNVQGGNFQQAF